MCIRDRIKLEGHSYEQLQSFIAKVRYCFNNIPYADLPDRRMLFSWLFDQLRTVPCLARKVERIRESREGSRKRSWEYLWGSLVSHIADRHADENITSFTRGLSSQKVPGAAAAEKTRRKQEKKQQQEQQLALQDLSLIHI